jgi:hypothetical protein
MAESQVSADSHGGSIASESESGVVAATGSDQPAHRRQSPQQRRTRSPTRYSRHANPRRPEIQKFRTKVHALVERCCIACIAAIFFLFVDVLRWLVAGSAAPACASSSSVRRLVRASRRNNAGLALRRDTPAMRIRGEIYLVSSGACTFVLNF